MPDIPKDTLVHVVWRDICACAKWLDYKEAIRWAARAYACEYDTVGYLLEINESFVVMAATQDREGAYNDVSMIPRAAVKKIVRLKG